MHSHNMTTQDMPLPTAQNADGSSGEQLAPDAPPVSPPVPRPHGTSPSRRAVVTAAGTSALTAGLTTASAAPASALSPATAPSTVPAATPPGTDPQAYTTVARAIAVYDEHDKPLAPAYLKVIDNGLPASRA